MLTALVLAGAAGVGPAAGQEGTPLAHTFRWGVQSPDLVRYNRVESASVGARGLIRPLSSLGYLTVALEARVGVADLHPGARLDVSRQTLTRRVTLSAYHELAAVDEGAGHLGLGNSAMAVLFGRDDGEYFRRTGMQMEWRPPSSQRATLRLAAFAEHHRPVETATNFTLWYYGDDDWRFRDNLVADEGWEFGGQLSLSPWWGTDPRRAQGGVEANVRAAAGDWEYVRSSLSGRLSMPLIADFRVGLDVGGGTSWGEPPAQRRWLLGGAGSLAGYAPRSREGTSYVAARAELARNFAFGALAAFTDLGWAGERDLFKLDDALTSIGLGLSLADGLIRMDAAWGLRAPRRFRLDLYLDAIL